jgi:glyoxylase-like metal-dependent hydrolase (beta-lactamase superfamily II)
MAQYLESLARMLALEARFALPSHGPPTGNAAALLRSTLEHRRAREQAILTALETPRTVAELLAVVYADVATELWPFAAKSLQAHLDKLANEQRIELRDERWRHGAPR